MSFLLKPDTYASVHSLFEDRTCHLAVVTVLTGSLKGRVYVDDPANPRTAILIPSNRHRVYVSGEPDPHLLADVIHLLSKEVREESYGFVMYDNPSHSWQSVLEQVLPGKQLLREKDTRRSPEEYFSSQAAKQTEEEAGSQAYPQMSNHTREIIANNVGLQVGKTALCELAERLGIGLASLQKQS